MGLHNKHHRLDPLSREANYTWPKATLQVQPPNPDPTNYKIIKAHEVGPFLVLKINYPNCTNFEGNKILVFKDLSLIELINQKTIDPHFFYDPQKKFASPIARFMPTDEGWQMAIQLTQMLTK